MKIRNPIRRDGVEVIEVALTLPLVVLITFMTIDVCAYIQLKQKAILVAYEAARTASQRDQDFESAENLAADLAEARNLTNVVISVEPVENPDRARSELRPGERIQSLVTIPANGNVTGPFFLFRNKFVNSDAIVIAVR